MPTRFRSSVTLSVHTKLNFKLLVLGESGVGKTSLLLRYVKDVFNKNFATTIGVEFYSKVVTVKTDEVALQIWDSGGQEQFQSMARSFLTHTHCVLIAYSQPSQVESTIQAKIYEMNQYAPEGIRLVVVRTKIDQNPLQDQQQKYLQNLVRQGEIDMWGAVSAKQDTNVGQFFEDLALKMHDTYQQNESFRELVDPKKGSLVLSKLEVDRLSQQCRKKRCCN